MASVDDLKSQVDRANKELVEAQATLQREKTNNDSIVKDFKAQVELANKTLAEVTDDLQKQRTKNDVSSPAPRYIISVWVSIAN